MYDERGEALYAQYRREQQQMEEEQEEYRWKVKEVEEEKAEDRQFFAAERELLEEMGGELDFGQEFQEMRIVLSDCMEERAREMQACEEQLQEEAKERNRRKQELEERYRENCRALEAEELREESWEF